MMLVKFTPRLANRFLFFKLPAAFWCGVRLKAINSVECITTVRFGWMNQNPFRSIYFAVQLMAAELSTGALVMKKIRESGYSISMLVGSQESEYFKKAVGRIFFHCTDGMLVDTAIQKAIETGEGQCVVLKSVGQNTTGETVCNASFSWYLKLRKAKS